MGQLTQYLCKWTVRVVCALLSPSSLLLFYENVSVMPSFLVFFFFGQIVLIKRNSILCCPILSEIILVTNKLDSYFMVIQFFLITDLPVVKTITKF